MFISFNCSDLQIPLFGAVQVYLYGIYHGVLWSGQPAQCPQVLEGLFQVKVYGISCV